MNQKITVKTQRGDICYFIIDPEKDIDAQLAHLHGHTSDHGVTARMRNHRIELVDYFHNDVMGFHDILSVEDTTEEVSLRWNPAE